MGLGFYLYGILIVCIFSSCQYSIDSDKTPLITENNFDSLSFRTFVEPDFPFFSTYLDLHELGENYPRENIVSRGMIINLGDSTYACFDRDLLRWSVAWSGKRLTPSMLPEVSYNDFFNKKNTVPMIAGDPDLATGMYPGLSLNEMNFDDVRSIEHFREGFKWGSLPTEYGHWKGFYLYEDKIVLSYSIGDVNIFELPSSVRINEEVVYTRTIKVQNLKDTVFFNAAEIINGEESDIAAKSGFIYYGKPEGSVLGIGVNGGNLKSGPTIRITDGRYLSVAIPPSVHPQTLTVFLWNGSSLQRKHFLSVIDSVEIDLPDFKNGGTSRWPEKLFTKGTLAPDTLTFVTDIVTLPLPNPWERNMRVTDLTFINEKKAAVSTFEGDIWIVDGIEDNLEKMTWKRYASGLYEPMSIEFFNGQLYTFGKEGIVRFYDLNGDNEADYYENFCNLMQQSAESYEWAQDMVISEKYGIVISKGGGLTARPGITKELMPGFRAGSNHSGVVMKISMDGKRAEVFSTGFRAPYLGLHPRSGILTVTDQQGNFVPATPIFQVDKGDFFGVPATNHRTDQPEPKRPLTWIPHRIDRSAGSEIWITSNKMGPLNDALVHVSFGKPGLFRVLLDTTSRGLQAAVVPIPSAFETPVSKGVIGPKDGQLYLAGFNLFGSGGKGISAIQRLRYTGIGNAKIPKDFSVGREGVIISFDTKIDSSSAIDPSNYRVKRWNYRRTEMYGSSHFKMDGNPGEEILPVVGAYLSKDQTKVLLLIPDIQQVDQMEILYELLTPDKGKFKDGIWFTVNYADDLNFNREGIEKVNLRLLHIDENQFPDLVKFDPPITWERGRELFRSQGCAGCHSPGIETDGMNGPPFKGLYGSKRLMKDGVTVIADDKYLIESILNPGKKIVHGYEAEMPSFRGILTDADIEALLLYIKLLKN